jgi:hypothetical protein
LINNSIQSSFSRTTVQLARHLSINAAVGIGTNISSTYDNGIIGQCFPLSQPDVLDSVRFYLRPGTPANQPVRAEVYACNAAGIPSGGVLASTITYTTTAQDALNGVVLSLPLQMPGLNLGAGTYFVGITENAGNLKLGTAAWYATPNQCFKRWNQNPYGSSAWTPLEQFGQQVALAIVPIFKPCLPISVSQSVQQASCGQANGSIALSLSGQSGAVQAIWQAAGGGLQGLQISNLAPGTYNCLLTDENGCQQTATSSISLLSPAVSIQLNSLQNNLCAGGTSGQISVAASGGIAPYNLSWTGPAGAISSPTNLTAGNYQLQLTDANSCQASASYTLTDPTPLTAQLNLLQGLACNGNSNGMLGLQFQGGVAPYALTWQGQPSNQSTFSNLAAGLYTAVITDAHGCSMQQQYQLSEPPVLQLVTVQQSNVLCAGQANGSVSVLASGGTAPYTYNWPSLNSSSPTQSGLAATSYMAHVTDNHGCVAMQTITISQPVSLQLQLLSQSNVTCFGHADGSAQLLAIGGTAPYVYTWPNLQQSGNQLLQVPAGSYTCTVHDANSCSSSLTLSITQNPAIQANLLSFQSALCGQANGALNVALSGGQAPYTQTWNTGQTNLLLTGLSAGVYSLNIHDALNCSYQQNFTVPSTNGPQLSLQSVQAASCFGAANGAIQLTLAQPAQLNAISWQPATGQGAGSLNYTNLSAGTYVCTVLDNANCQTQLSVVVPQASQLQLQIQNLQGASCFGDTNGAIQVQANGGTAPYAYFWPSISQVGSGQTNLSAGNYPCIVTDAHGCSDTLAIQLGQAPALAAQFTVQQAPVCSYSNGGVLLAAASGGSAPYVYNWNPLSASGPLLTQLTPGNVQLTIQDANGCQFQISYALEAQSVLNPQVTVVSESCFGAHDGSILLDSLGASSPTSVSWSNASSNFLLQQLGAGTYTAWLADALGCLDTLSLTIASTSNLQLTLSGTNQACPMTASGQLVAQQSGGLEPIQWSINGQIASSNSWSNLLPGLYSVTATDAATCQDSAMFVIEASDFTVQTSAIDALCVGFANGMAIVQPTGGQAPYATQWLNTLETGDSLIGLQPGTYFYEVHDAMNCVLTGSVLVQPSIELQLNAQISNELFGQDGTIQLAVSNGLSPYNYAWEDGQISASISALASGWYAVQVTDQNGCSLTDSLFVASELGLVTSEAPDFLVYPNPTTGMLYLPAAVENEWHLFLPNGTEICIQTQQENAPHSSFDLSRLPSGVYYLEVHNKQQVRRYPIVKL